MNPISNPQLTDLPDDVVLSVRNVSKKFCRNLRRSMLYGMQDLAKNMLGIRPGTGVPGKGRNGERESLMVNCGTADGHGASAESCRSATQTASRLTNNVSPTFPGAASLPPLRKHEFWALQETSFDLRRGECLGLIGRNGSGKTTLLRMIAGIFPPDGGEIVVRGKVGSLIALGAGFHPHLTGRENIYLNGTILGMHKREIDAKIEEIIEFAEIGAFIDAPVTTYSSGMTVRLGFSIAAFQKPDLLLIDEVLAVGDTGFREKCMNLMVRFLENTAIIFVSHSMPMIARMCNRILLMDKAKPLYLGTEVPHGIEMYDNMFTYEAKPRIAGSGRIHVVQPAQLFLADGGGNLRETREIPCRAEMTLSVGVRLDSAVRRITPSVVICRKTGEYVMCCFGRHDGFSLHPAGDALTVTVRMQNLLTPGEYDVSIAFHEDEPGKPATNVSETLAYFINVIRFRVPVDRVISAAPVDLPGRWSVTEMTSPADRG